MTTREAIKRTVWKGIIVLILFALLIFAHNAFGQEGPQLSAQAEGRTSVWAQHDRCYQHSYSGAGKAKLVWGPAFAEAFVRIKLWGACDAKIASSPLNAEIGKVIERWHGVNVGIEIIGIQAGATVRRDAVHHIWRNADDRHRDFPGGNDWKGAMQRCQGKAKKLPWKPAACPGIGYYDGVGPYIGYDNHGLDVEITGPQYRWKELTLPWPDWTLDAVYTHSAHWPVDLWITEMNFRGFRLRLNGQTGGPAYQALSGEAQLRITRRVAIGARGGRVDVPGWRKPVDRVALTLEIR